MGDRETVSKIWVYDKHDVHDIPSDPKSSHTFYNEDEEDPEESEQEGDVLIAEGADKKKNKYNEVTLLDMILSFGGFAKLVACIMFLSSAIVFNNATIEDHTVKNRKLSKAPNIYLILPACDITLAIAGPLIYLALLILMAKGHIRNMIVLDVTYTLIVLLMTLLASMVTMPEVGEIHINAAIMMLTGTIVQVVSGFSTLINYCPRPRHLKLVTSGSQI